MVVPSLFIKPFSTRGFLPSPDYKVPDITAHLFPGVVVKAFGAELFHLLFEPERNLSFHP
jgi:hypothetical protein